MGMGEERQIDIVDSHPWGDVPSGFCSREGSKGAGAAELEI